MLGLQQILSQLEETPAAHVRPHSSMEKTRKISEIYFVIFSGQTFQMSGVWEGFQGGIQAEASLCHPHGREALGLFLLWSMFLIETE